MKNYRLSNHSLVNEQHEKDMINDAGALMHLIRKLLEVELNQVEKKLDSETLFELPAYEDRLKDLIAQRRTYKKIIKLFEEVDHA